MNKLLILMFLVILYSPDLTKAVEERAKEIRRNERYNRYT